MKTAKIIISIIMTMLCMESTAQPSAVKNAAKSVFYLETYGKDGNILATSHGVFVGEQGECISDLKPFLGAAKAVVTDAKGNKMEVTRMLGINDIYKMARFKVSGKTVQAAISQSPSTAGSEAWLVSYGAKNPQLTPATVKSVETFMGKYSYYIFTFNAPDNTTACPYVYSSGQIIGLMQPSATNSDIHATDAKFAQSLNVTGLTFSDATMQKIGIPAALPEDKNQALLALMVNESNPDSVKLKALTNDFIAQFPTSVEGYSALAKIYANENKFDNAAKEMETAVDKVENKDEAHYDYSKLIYNKELYKGDIPYKPWNLDKALDEINKAQSINPQLQYRHLWAQITFSKGEYQKAYDTLMELTKSKYRNPELFYEASRCKQMLNAPSKEVIALLDSAINNTDTLQIRTAAEYFLARGGEYNKIDSFRQAVFDYTRYEILTGGQVSASFYYMREQAEVKGRLYKQALIDIAKAIILAPEEPTYYAEAASLQLKVNMTDEALKTASRCVEIAPEYSTGYILLGLAQINKGNKTEGLANLAKAKELGDEQAQKMIDKYSK